MKTFDDAMEEFESRLDAIARQYRDERLSSRRAEHDIEVRLQAYEARLHAMTREHRRRVEATIASIWRRHLSRHNPPSGVPARGADVRALFPASKVMLNGEPVLKELDALFVKEFRLFRHFRHEGLENLPTVYCETLEEFFQPHVEMLDVSEETRQKILRSLVEEARKRAEKGGGTWGVFWPGRGCYINGWLFAYGRAQDARAALRDPEILPAILATVAHEKLGHGFVSEYTALGEEKKRLGTWRYDIARRFNMRVVDTPESALLAEKEAVLYTSSQLLEEGWAVWIEHHIMKNLAEHARHEGRAWTPVSSARYTTTQLWHTLTQILDEGPDAPVAAAIRAVLEAVEVLLLQERVKVEDIHRAILTLHHNMDRVDSVAAARLGQPLRYVIGYLLLRDLEARLGTLCLPYAVVIGANVSYDLERIASGDLQRIVAQNPRLNVDSRLAQMRLLTLPQKNDLAALVEQAHRVLNLARPGNLQV